MAAVLPRSQSFAAMTRGQMIARATALVPSLRERAAEAETLRQIPQQTIHDLHESGLLRMVQPRRVGGAELDFTILVDACAEIARGCASTAWVLGNLSAHHWMLAMWPRQAQDELWGESPDTLIGSALVFPAGRASRVDGGFLLKGHWPFSSGVDPCTWNMLGALVEDTETGAREYRMFLVPRQDYQIIDTWFVSGLSGTGSKDVKVEEVFVPEYRTLAVDATKGGEHPGSAANTGAVFRIPVFALFPYMLSGVTLGVAQGTLELFVAASRTRMASYSGRNVADFTSVQMKIAEASACIDAARLIMRTNCIEAQQLAEQGEVPDLPTKTKYRRDGAFASELCVRAVDTLFRASGGGGLYYSNPIQRAFRDVHACAAHISMIWDAAATTFGRVALGMPSDNPTL